jgi:hypothetical protein
LEVAVADRQFSRRVESGRSPTDEAIAAAYVRALSMEEAAKLLGVSLKRLRTWAAAGYTRSNELSIARVREARIEYEGARRLERGREFHDKRRARIAEIEAEIQKGLEAQRVAHQKLMSFASLCRTELLIAVEKAKGTAPKKAARAKKRLLRKCETFVESCKRARVDLPAHEDDPGA